MHIYQTQKKPINHRSSEERFDELQYRIGTGHNLYQAESASAPVEICSNGSTRNPDSALGSFSLLILVSLLMPKSLLS
jgi:hypothetical protein